MSYLFSLLSLFNIWFILKQASLFRMNKHSKDILLQAVSQHNNQKINLLLKKDFKTYLSENKDIQHKLLSNLMALNDDIVLLDFKKLKLLNKQNISKLLWYFNKKDDIQSFLRHNVSITNYYNACNSSFYVEIGFHRQKGVGDLSMMGYTSLKDKTKYFLGSSKENLDRISYKYLQDLLILERWKRRYFK